MFYIPEEVPGIYCTQKGNYITVVSDVLLVCASFRTALPVDTAKILCVSFVVYSYVCTAHNECQILFLRVRKGIR